MHWGSLLRICEPAGREKKFSYFVAGESICCRITATRNVPGLVLKLIVSFEKNRHRNRCAR